MESEGIGKGTIDTFVVKLGQITHRAISNMQKVGMTSKLKAMWCTFTNDHDDRNNLE